MNRIAVIIVAGGSGSRMGAEVPKQFLVLDGLPILMHTIRRFAETLADARTIVVLPAAHIGYWRNLCREYAFTTPHEVCEGGATRFESVRRGLDHAGDAGIAPVAMAACRPGSDSARRAGCAGLRGRDSGRRTGRFAAADRGRGQQHRRPFCVPHRPDSAGFPHGNSPESLSTAFSGLFYRRCERGRGGRRTDISLRRFLYEYQNYYAGRYRDGRGVAESPVVPPRQSVPPVPVPWSF